MKKLMVVAAAALCATAFADIESSNVVGYNTQAIQGGKLKCVSFQFTAIDTPTQASLANISTKGLTPGVYDTMLTDAPCIMIYNGIAYDNYYYISDADDGTESYNLTGWADGYGNIASTVGILGTGYWLQIPADKCSEGELTEAGQVSPSDSITVDIAAGLTLTGNPYPTTLNLKNVKTEGLTAGVYETMLTDAPCIMIYNGVAYDNYYYISDADDGTERYDLTGWADGYGNIAEGIATTGTGFWLSSSKAGTLTFTR